MSDSRPTYLIPAHEVVPGMLLRATSAYLWPVLQIGQHEDRTPWLEVNRGDYEPRRYGFRADEVVTVELPGPSPRELACTCWDEALGHDSEYRWEDEAIRQHGAACSEYAQRRAELACVLPSEHSPDCPVAPVPGRHGGMRLWPAPWRGGAWFQDGDDAWMSSPHGSDGYSACVWAGELCTDRTWDGGRADMILQCFYLPSEPQPERCETPAWDPYGTDLDLAVRYG